MFSIDARVYVFATIALMALLASMTATADDVERVSLAERYNHSEVPRRGEVGENFVPIEEFGAVGDGVYYWGTLDITPLGDGTSRIIYTGEDAPFYADYVGRWFVSARIHLNPPDYPEQSPNYFPGLLACRYSKVISVEDGRNLIVDFEYNGGDREHPKSVEDTDGLFFTDNREAIARAAMDENRPETVSLQDDQVYVMKGLPNTGVAQSITFIRSYDGEQSPRLKMSLEDAFNADGGGGGAGSPSFTADFHSNTFIRVPNNDMDIIFEGIDIVGPTYLMPVVQYGHPLEYFFVDRDYQSRRTGRALVIDSDIYAEKKDIIDALGEPRDGMSWSLPEFGHCNSGGDDDGEDIVALAEYGLYNTSWFARGVQGLKGQTRAGILFKVVGDDQRVELTEDWALKATEFNDVELSFSRDEEGHLIATNHSDHFNWLMVANQDWSGGTSTNFHAFNIIDIDGFRFYMNNNADWWYVSQPEIRSKTVLENGRAAGVFDNIPKVGERIEILAKVDDKTFDIYGWSLQVGDVLGWNGNEFEIVERQRIPDRGGRTFNKTFVDARGEERIAQIKPWRITLDGAIEADEPLFTVAKSQTEYLLDGEPRKATVGLNRGPFGHLFYTDQGCNIYLDNVDTSGYWRSTSRAQPDKLYWAASVAVFRNSRISQFGYPWETYLRPIEWQPAFMRYREQIQGEDYRWIIDNTEVLIRQTTDTRATIETRNAPAFVTSTRLHNPVNGDDTGIRVQNEDEGGAIHIFLTDGHQFSVNGLTNCLLRVSGHGTIVVDNYTGMAATDERFKGRMQGLAISGSGPLTILGDGGASSIRNESPNTLNRAEQLLIRLTNWTPAGEYYSNRFLALGDDILNDPELKNHIEITDKDGNDLVKP